VPGRVEGLICHKSLSELLILLIIFYQRLLQKKCRAIIIFIQSSYPNEKRSVKDILNCLRKWCRVCHEFKVAYWTSAALLVGILQNYQHVLYFPCRDFFRLTELVQLHIQTVTTPSKLTTIKNHISCKTLSKLWQKQQRLVMRSW